MSSRKSVKFSESVYDKLINEKSKEETWDSFANRLLQRPVRDPKIDSSEMREAARTVLREEATTDKIRTEIQSILDDRLSKEIQSVIQEDPPEEVIRDLLENILREKGLASSKSHPVDDETHAKLIGVVETAPSRMWMNKYFDKVAQLIEKTGVDKDDETLVMSIRPTQNSLPVSISQRYCLKGFPDKQMIGAILPHNSDAIEDLREEATHTGQFSGSDRPDPYYYALPAPSAGDFFIEDYEEDWIRALQNEVKRGYRRRNEDAHEPAVYRAAVDIDYREQVLDEAFTED